MSSAGAPAGMFGKIPAQGDFVRAQLSDPAAQALGSWLQEGLDAMQRAGARLDATAVRFVFRASGTRNVLVGALAASADAVGRAFPLALFHPAEAAKLAALFPALPLAYEGFLRACDGLLAEAPTVTAAELTERLRLLPAPAESDWAAAEGERRRTLAEPAGEWQAPLLGDANLGRAYYAMRTVAIACDPVRGREPTRANVTLDCPAGSSKALLGWLELVWRSLRWREAPPSFVWTDGPGGRLLLALGPTPAAALLYLAKPDHSGAKLWPLCTDSAVAISDAKRALTEGQLRAIDGGGASLDTLLTALAGGS